MTQTTALERYLLYIDGAEVASDAGKTFTSSAAVVMVAVFSIFATLEMLDFKMMGVGLAVAILIDATIVRAVLLPSVMKLLGKWNWYLPRWLDWLPRVAVERAAPALSSPPTAGSARPRHRARLRLPASARSDAPGGHTADSPTARQSIRGK